MAAGDVPTSQTSRLCAGREQRLATSATNRTNGPTVAPGSVMRVPRRYDAKKEGDRRSYIPTIITSTLPCKNANLPAGDCTHVIRPTSAASA